MLYRVKYWVQDTQESGHWQHTGPMSADAASVAIDEHFFDRCEIVPDHEYEASIDEGFEG
jgi:hypothetical protein